MQERPAEGHNSSMEMPQRLGKLLTAKQRTRELFDTVSKEQPPGHKVGCKRTESGSDSLEESILHIEQLFFPHINLGCYVGCSLFNPFVSKA